MAPVRTKKRASDAMADQRVPVRPSPTTPHHRSPIKKRKGAISLQQKQALIDNLQLERTGISSDVEARCDVDNSPSHRTRSTTTSPVQPPGARPPIACRNSNQPNSRVLAKDQDGRSPAQAPGARGEAVSKSSSSCQGHSCAIPPEAGADQYSHCETRRTRSKAHEVSAIRSEAISFLLTFYISDPISGDKENDLVDNAKKRIRVRPGADVRPAQILSPTSSNSRLNRPRPASPVKSAIARPASPLKNSGPTRTTATSVLSSMVEKAKATRAGAARKVTATSNASSSSSGTTAATRTRRAAAPAASRAPASRPATRNARRVSSNSETSEGSTGTVVKRGAAAKPASATKRGMMSSIRKGVTGGAKKAATKAAAPAAAPTTGTGRVLRKRG